MSVTRWRIGAEVFDKVFRFVLSIAEEKRLLAGKTVGVDSTTLEATAARRASCDATRARIGGSMSRGSA
jgi:transposase